MREHTRHRLAFDAYVALGAQRSLERLRDAIGADPASHGFPRPPGLRTLYRWSAKGIRGVRLETIRVGGSLCTSVQALQRFFDRLSGPRGDAAAAGRVGPQEDRP